jgi:outer membrane receptor protein involved in Fe transport
VKRVVVAVLLLATPCFAQQGTTAELTGRVASAGQALPGVSVTLTSGALQGSRVTVTGENGGYLFAFLPPADYLLRFDLQGFTAVERSVRVPLAVTTRVDVELEATPLHETVTVESGSARVAASASIGTNLRAAELQRLPGGRDIRAAVLLSPSASAQGPTNRLVIAGAPTWDSLFLVDGVVVNEYLSGQPHDLFIEDAIQEIAVLTGAVSAEYGRFTGGVVSTLTKSGGNEFHGSLRDTLTNGVWTKRTPLAGQPDPLDKVNHAVEATLGGFLLRDRLWFFAAGRKAEASLGRFTALTNYRYRIDSHEERRDVKVTQQITVRHSLIASYIHTSLAETNAIDPDRGGRVAELAGLIANRRQPARLLALTYEGLLAPNTFAEIHGSRKRYALLGNGGGSADPVLGTVIVVRGQGVNLNAPIGCGVCGPDKRDSSGWAAKTSHYGNTRWGNHTTVVGAEGFHEQRVNSGSRSASEFNIQTGSAQILGASAYPVFDAATGIDWTHPIAGSRGTDQNTGSAYLNDRWDLSSRLGVNLGVRYDRNKVRDAVRRVVSDDDAYCPRVSATFDLRNDGRHRLIAGYGRYTAKILDQGAAPQQVGTFTELSWRYRGTPINSIGTPVDQLLPAPEALARLFAWFDSVGGVQNRQYLGFFTDPRYTSEFRQSLKSPAVDEWSLGYAMQLQRGFLRADYIARDWHHFYASRVDTTTGQRIGPTGKPLDVAWIINDDSGTVRTYRAIQLQGSWHYRQVTAGGGYTWSTLRGNDDEEEGIALSAPRNLPLSLWYPEFLGYAQRRPIGYLAQDQRHRARLWVGYEAALHRASLSAFLLQRFDSGRPYSAVANIDPTGGNGTYEGIPANPGYALNQVHMGPYFFSKRGAFRTDDVFSTDLAANYEIPYRSLRLFFKGDVLNLFNNAAVVSPSTVVITGFAASGLRTFNPFTEVPVEGLHYRRSPNFGEPTGPESYQTPRTFQLSLGARF